MWRFLLGLILMCGVLAAENDEVSRKFHQLDRDGDNFLTEKELPGPILFRQMDSDRSGKVTLSEARSFFSRPAGKRLWQAAEAHHRKKFAPKCAAPSAEEEASLREGPRPLKASAHRIGRLMPDFAFTDISGKAHRLSDYADKKACVFVLTTTGCPLAKKMMPSVIRSAAEFAKRDVAFFLVNVGEADRMETMMKAIGDYKINIPYVPDPKGKLSAFFAPLTTTEAFVVDAAGTLVYRGAVHDQYGFAYSLDAPRSRYLVDALEAVLAGETPPQPAMTAPGCEVDIPRLPLSKTVTYHNRISRIMQQNCVECHREDGLGPFSLETPGDVIANRKMITRMVTRDLMPPWFAADMETPADGHSGWSEDRALEADDKADLLGWLSGARELGDPGQAPLARRFPRDWEMGKPDAIFRLPKAVEVKAEGTMPYVNLKVETDFKEDRWVRAFELRPTDRAVVHHVLVFVINRAGGKASREDNGFFAAYVPGNNKRIYPEGFAKKLPKGATLLFQMHYTPIGRATVDQTELGLIFADQPPVHEVRTTGISNRRIQIPPHAANHEETATIPVPVPVRLLGLMPHMHLRGKAIRYEVVLPDGESQMLLDLPRYDFNWQLMYRFAVPHAVPAGSSIRVTGWFDNSAGNPANPSPGSTVRWGKQTEDEMLIGYAEFYVPGVR
ncbi:MAG: peroxiredoxin [Rhodothermales bacterium]|jgi:peroxiredoxin